MADKTIKRSLREHENHDEAPKSTKNFQYHEAIADCVQLQIPDQMAKSWLKRQFFGVYEAL